VEAYRSILTWFSPGNIIVAGESAGGNMAVALCLQLSRLGLPVPGGLILMSPWIDLLDHKLPPWEDCKDYLPPDLITAFADAYVGSQDAKHEFISPFYSDSLHLLPRTLLIYGSGETLGEQDRRFGELLRSRGVEVSVYVGPGQVHAFPVYADVAYGSLGQAVVLASALASAAALLTAASAVVAFVAAAVGMPLLLAQALALGAVAVAAAEVSVVWLKRRRLRNELRAFDDSSSEDSEEDCEGEEELAWRAPKGEKTHPAPYEAYRQIGAFAREVWSASEV